MLIKGEQEENWLMEIGVDMPKRQWFDQRICFSLSLSQKTPKDICGRKSKEPILEYMCTKACTLISIYTKVKAGILYNSGVSGILNFM